ncbi:hypothetical protein [Fulvivirga lutimaris]|uniref:hypothetical protein n=1 Tax=Fulvivirga lutimaris TaxID=1819566 RepID=UPI0012BD15A3|nr:hypothetical protein [Fulvivirga lutimaris]MTI40236.1 hypothetical protein [Fulvivirga lutimaris]
MKTKSFLLLLLTVFLVSNSLAQDSKIIVMNQYWAKEGKIQEVYQHRLYASEVRKKLGLAVGRVLLNTEAEAGSPHVIWECEYPSNEAREKDIQLLTESGQFEDVMEKMGTLIDKFDRSIYKTLSSE